MENIFKKNILLIVDSNGNLFPYEKEMGVRHKDCLDNFSKLKKYQDSTIETVVNNGNIIFYNLTDDDYVVGMPFQISTLQLYMLDYLNDMMDIITKMEVNKIEKSKKKYILLESNEQTSVKEQFSLQVINSYLETNERKVL